MAENSTLWTWDNQQKYHEELQVDIDNKISKNGITVDDVLSDTSENPVQNKVIKTQLDINLSEAKTYADSKLITGTEAASLDNCPEGCWYGQYS